jgi:hypothetical protein
VTGGYAVDRLVVVHGGEDELLAATLALAGLEAVYLTPDLTVWAPTRWGLETNLHPINADGYPDCEDVTGAETAELFLAYFNQGDTI